MDIPPREEGRLVQLLMTGVDGWSPTSLRRVGIACFAMAVVVVVLWRWQAFAEPMSWSVFGLAGAFGCMGALCVFQAAQAQRRLDGQATSAALREKRELFERYLQTRLAPPSAYAHLIDEAQAQLDRRVSLRALTGLAAIAGLLVARYFTPESWERPLGVQEIAALFLVMAGALAAWELSQLRTLFWTTVPARVLLTAVLADGRSSLPAVFREYHVAGRRYVAYRVHVTGPPGSPEDAQRVCDTYQVGSEVRCAVSPFDARRSVLDRRARVAGLIVALAISAGCVVVILLVG